MISGIASSVSNFRKRVILIDTPERTSIFKFLIESSKKYKVIETYTMVEVAIANLKYDKPDIIISEIELEGLNGLDGILEIHKFNQGIEVIICTDINNHYAILQAFSNGAIGYLLKDECHSRFIDLIDELDSGGSPITPKPARMLIQSMKRNPSSPLTFRETEILKLLSKGNTYSEMAVILGISKETTKTHLRNIYRKLDVKSRSSVIKLALEERLI
jgi:DNA-binding NarL/FixJ family response regulator